MKATRSYRTVQMRVTPYPFRLDEHIRRGTTRYPGIIIFLAAENQVHVKANIEESRALRSRSAQPDVNAPGGSDRNSSVSPEKRE